MDFSKIDIPILFAVTLVATVFASTYNAVYVKKRNANVSDLFLVNAGFGIFCSLTLLCLGGFSIQLSLYSTLLGAFFGLVTTLFSVTQQSAIKKGPYGLTCIIINGSTAITALSGAVFFSERLTFFKVAGMVCMLACIFLSTENKKDDKKTSFKWLLLCVFAMLLSSSVGLTQKIHQSSDYRQELIGFLIVAFAVSTVFSIIVYFIKRNTEIRAGTHVAFEPNARSVGYLMSVMGLVGICIGLENAINLYLSGVVESVVFFPVVNGVPLMASLIVSFVFFKEKLSPKQIAGLVFGLVAIACFFI